MARVAVVTDSSACLPADLLKAHRITTVPLTFLFDGEPRYDGALSGREFYALLRASRRFPTTAAPAPAAFLEAYRQAATSAESALCVTLPAAFSGTYDSALTAAEMAREELPGFPVRVVDSHCLAMCHGFAVLYAARAAAAGATLDEAEAVAREVGLPLPPPGRAGHPALPGEERPRTARVSLGHVPPPDQAYPGRGGGGGPGRGARAHDASRPRPPARAGRRAAVAGAPPAPGGDARGRRSRRR